MRKNKQLSLALLVLITAVLACGTPGADPQPNETVQALTNSLNQTATAEAAPTNTPAPDATATPLSESQSAVGTAQSQATEISVAATGTRNIQATEQAIQAEGTAQAFIPIQQELQSLGIDTSAGRLAWTQDPLTLFAEGYLQYEADVQFVTVATDFVVATDVTWNTDFGTTGCGVVVRDNGDEEAGDRYLIVATRGGNGRVITSVQLDGNLVQDDTVDIYANGIDPLFEWQNDTTNRLVVIGRGNTFSIYTNGTFLGDFTPQSAFFERGFVAFVALNESGQTTCTFTNAYLWLIQ